MPGLPYTSTIGYSSDFPDAIAGADESDEALHIRLHPIDITHPGVSGNDPSVGGDARPLFYTLRISASESSGMAQIARRHELRRPIVVDVDASPIIYPGADV